MNQHWQNSSTDASQHANQLADKPKASQSLYKVVKQSVKHEINEIKLTMTNSAAGKWNAAPYTPGGAFTIQGR